jgi:hypothetical protein
VELSDGAEAQVAEVDAERTRYSRNAGWMLWALVCMTFSWDPVLFADVRGTPTMKDCLAAEQKLLVFAHWLGRDYAYSTVVRYVGDVKAWQRLQMGIPLQALGVAFFRLPLLFKVLKREKPPSTHDKKPWEFEYFGRIIAGTPGARVADFGADAVGFQRCTVWVMMLLAFEQLMRMSELVTTQKPSIAERNPLKMGDRRYIDSKEREVRFDAAGRPVMPTDGAYIAFCVMRMPPSKTDVVGVVDGLILPFPSRWTPRSRGCPTAAGPALWRRDCQFPVPVKHRWEVPMFGMQQWRVGKEKVLQFSQNKFVTVRKQLCRANMATPEIRYDKLGLHAFRVGGVNRLMDLGATGPQICAAGRWAGDCWILYARRQRAVLIELTQKMSAG